MKAKDRAYNDLLQRFKEAETRANDLDKKNFELRTRNGQLAVAVNHLREQIRSLADVIVKITHVLPYIDK